MHTLTTVDTEAGTRLEQETYKTDLLPGFELPLAKLLAVADQWTDKE